jgi:hypothetical protein
MSPDGEHANTEIMAKTKHQQNPSLYLNNLKTKGQAGQYKMMDENDQSQ